MDRKKQVLQLLEKHGGCREDAIAALFGGQCSRETAEQLALAFSLEFGLTIAEFMYAHDRWVHSRKITLPSPEEKQNQPPH
jgi:hypothetical protein